MGMAGEFVTKPQVLGTMTMKNTKLQFVANPRANPISCPVAVLVDECSISSAEILAGGLQDLGLARIFGSRTAGLALPSVIIKLPNGDGFQYAVANYESADGATLEVNGVEPDEPVSVTRQKLLVDPDPVLTAAVGWIQNPK
jgi:carboxyl-terminal processing protease